VICCHELLIPRAMCTSGMHEHMASEILVRGSTTEYGLLLYVCEQSTDNEQLDLQLLIDKRPA
jgi:hypothetical protein